MYRNAKNLIHSLLKNEKSDLIYFIESLTSGFYSFSDTESSIKKLGVAIRKAEKHLACRAHTSKWQEQHKKIRIEYSDAWANLSSNITRAHLFLFMLIKFLYAAEMQDKGKILNPSDMSDTFASVFSQLTILDSFDNERIILFNRLRNVLFHTDGEQFMRFMNKDSCIELMALCSDINSLCHQLYNSKKDKINFIVIKEAQRILEPSQLELKELM